MPPQQQQPQLLVQPVQEHLWGCNKKGLPREGTKVGY